jgi:hypothetical protein
MEEVGDAEPDAGSVPSTLLVVVTSANDGQSRSERGARPCDLTIGTFLELFNSSTGLQLADGHRG